MTNTAETIRVHAVLDITKLQQMLRRYGIEVTLEEIAANTPEAMKGLRMIGIAGISACQAPGWAEHCRNQTGKTT